MDKRFFILLFLLQSVFVLQAQDGYTTDTVVQTVEAPIEENYNEPTEEYYTPDTNLIIHPVYLEKDSISNWKKRKEFSYVNNLDSLLKAYQDKQKEPKPTRTSGGNSFMSRLLGGPLLKMILSALAIFFVGVILYQLLKSKGFFQRSSSLSAVAEKPGEEEELLLHNDFDQLIGQAYKLGDYRMAVRYLFLKTLQQLRDKNQISYEPDKTNSRYVYELPVNWRNDFSKLIFQYEYVWYGHFDVNREQYEEVQKGFNSFIQKI